MTVKHIIKVPNPFLRKKAMPVEKITDEIKKLLNDMLETMYHANGIGLAATQIEENKRLIVMDCGKNHDNMSKNEKHLPNPIKMINPELIFKSKEIKEREEGCLSIPGYQANVKRPNFVKVSYFDENNNKKELKAEGLLSACVQHEIDHLNGILFVDHLSKLKKEIILKKAIKDYKNINRD
tara:strand:+ start:1718 stop:2260 length:543 start_codon:yes stop_codon:yes gene_type:complete